MIFSEMGSESHSVQKHVVRFVMEPLILVAL
jgi:hypothetical protein